MLYVVDRIEENIAVLVSSEDKSTCEAEVSVLYDGVREGDIVRKTRDGYIFEEELTARKKESIKSRFDRLKIKMSDRKREEK